MRNIFIVPILAGGSVACGASPDATSEELDTARQPIVRGTPENGRPQVVLLHLQRYDGSLVRCSGVYVAPRIVLTAAHCLRDDLNPQGGYVYFGDDYGADLSQLEQLPEPGQPSEWARAEGWEKHPDWDPARFHPDLGVVYLDRLLPFWPLPIAPIRLGDEWKGVVATEVGWGADRALTADLSEFSGLGVKRSGRTRILGSPTEADYHPDDPNPGMLVPEIREHTLKTDGRAPFSNACAGDSGGPLLVSVGGLSWVAGIASWTGLSCEDYALYSRLDPFLPFLEQSFAKGGFLPLRPELGCVSETDRGDLVAYFGYDNRNAVTVHIPHGWFNAFPQDHEHQRPSAFRPGSHPWAFRVRFSARDRLDWWLTSPRGTFTALHVDAGSPRCDFAKTHGIVESCEASSSVSCGESFMDCTDRGYAELEMLRSWGIPCTDEFDAVTRCIAALPRDGFVCSGSEPIPAGGLCDEQSLAYITCLGF